MYKIGIIDDEESAIRNIRRTIKIHKPEDCDVDFKIYLLSNFKDTIIPELSKQILNDIKENEICTLIIDEKIIANMIQIQGTDIFQNIKKEVDKFPMIMLTNVVEECMNNSNIDPDKVYKKSEFFKIEGEYSKEQVIKIFLNAKKYVESRRKIENNIDSLEGKIVEQGNNQEIVSEIIDNQEKLKELKPTDYSQIEKVINPERLKEIIQLIKEANDLLE